MWWVFLAIQKQLIYTSIFHLPIKHHSVLLTNEKSYLIDFIPVDNIRYPKTILKLLLGKNMRGEIRLRYNIDETYKTEEESRLLTQKVYESMNPEMKNFVDSLEWDETMNLYTRNCQHFGRYVLST
jgi:hypothetical protein